MTGPEHIVQLFGLLHDCLRKTHRVAGPRLEKTNVIGNRSPLAIFDITMNCDTDTCTNTPLLAGMPPKHGTYQNFAPSGGSNIVGNYNAPKPSPGH